MCSELRVKREPREDSVAGTSRSILWKPEEVQKWKQSRGCCQTPPSFPGGRAALSACLLLLQCPATRRRDVRLSKHGLLGSSSSGHGPGEAGHLPPLPPPPRRPDSSAAWSLSWPLSAFLYQWALVSGLVSPVLGCWA